MRNILRVAAAVAVLVLLACVMVPNYLQARNRSRQNRTMADMRTIATAWEARATDINSYSVDAKEPAEHRVSAADLTRALEPTYVRKLARTDGWGTEFQFTTGGYESGDGQASTYTIRSLASDRRPDRIANLSGPTTNFSDDVIYSNGAFIRYPEGSG